MNSIEPSQPRGIGDRLVVFVAQGFGSGLLPLGPGTWGSGIGVLWLITLLSSGSGWVFVAANVIAVLGAVALCTRAETLLGSHDPPSVVMDEIVAVPLTFLGTLLAIGVWPVGLAGQPFKVVAVFWPELLTGFMAFRVFDIWKPGPIRRVQSLPRGWGVVADDIFAALAAAVVTGLVTVVRLR
ncbi:MAG TPA: phosphatidylglycerophosphatase A [Verrucomicrobiota bacterium]|nr:phosphatidylglycerophosphatase A [Verrucomicrobiota bacterium]